MIWRWWWFSFFFFFLIELRRPCIVRVDVPIQPIRAVFLFFFVELVFSNVVVYHCCIVVPTLNLIIFFLI